MVWSIKPLEKLPQIFIADQALQEIKLHQQEHLAYVMVKYIQHMVFGLKNVFRSLTRILLPTRSILNMVTFCLPLLVKVSKK